MHLKILLHSTYYSTKWEYILVGREISVKSREIYIEGTTPRYITHLSTTNHRKIISYPMVFILDGNSVIYAQVLSEMNNFICSGTSLDRQSFDFVFK